MRATLATLLMTLGLGACVSDQEFNQSMAACERPGPRLAVAKCENAVMYASSTAPRDIMDVMAATRESVATKVDSGQISATDAKLQVAQMKSQLVGEVQRRGAVDAQATAAILASTPRPVSCTSNGFGNTVTTRCY